MWFQENSRGAQRSDAFNNKNTEAYHILTSSQCFLHIHHNPKSAVCNNILHHRAEQIINKKQPSNASHDQPTQPIIIIQLYTSVHAYLLYTTRSSLTLIRDASMTPCTTSSLINPVAWRTVISSGATELFPIETEVRMSKFGVHT